MGLEKATYISQLTATNPTSSDPVSQGDDHLRLIKSVLQSQFTTLGAAAVTTTAAELNLLDGKTAVGDVTGPGSSVDNAIARFSGTGGKTIQNTTVTISDDPPVVKIGDGTAEDTTILFDGNAKDFYMALDDTADKLVIGEGSTVGTNSIMTITDDTVTIGDGATADTYLNFDGNAQDYRIGLDDGTDKLEVGVGTAHGTTISFTVDSSADVDFNDNVVSNPEIKDYKETVQSVTGNQTVNTALLANGNVINWSGSGTVTLDTPAVGYHGVSFTLIGQSAMTIAETSTNDIFWAGGTTPTPSGICVFNFFCTLSAAGTYKWFGFDGGQDWAT